MNKFFRSAIERFSKLKGEKEFLINPISEPDSEIIVELTQILKKAGLNEVNEILKSWKENKDIEIRDELLQYNIDHPHLGIKKLVDKIADKISDEIDEEEQPTPSYIKIQNIMLYERDLYGVESYDRYDKEKEDYIFGIRLNPMPLEHKMKNVPLWADYNVEFTTEEERDTVLNNIEQFLQDKGFNIIEM